MHRHYRRLLAAAGAAVAVTVAAPLAFAAPQNGAAGGKGDQAVEVASEAELAATRPAFKMPFECGQVWLGSNWNGHSPAHSIDWNHYDSNGNPDDRGRRVFASAGGTVLESHYSTTTGYGNTIVIGHGNGWQTRYAHLKTRAVQKGAQIKVGQKIGQVGATSAKYTLSPHLHYEQIHNGRTVVAVVQGVTWHDFTKRNQTSNNRCG
ncbi:M23 family metallopeptidase [Streptomyces sp. XM4193]|uniref:M23 family metallopeptidase n=1 Tax=Streptomyces sp. XM4193 TaxID=2929782 RepID=UPI001FFB05B8|nr:M23 family metallopeptidase [Streptomyces sp. XM4193]MCK1794459.1 M23 family metallopeptidase [Streptomyces sp. XM4193]